MAHDADYRQNEVPAGLDCLRDAAEKVGDFKTAGSTGNVGSQYGTRILLEPSEFDLSPFDLSKEEADGFFQGAPPVSRLIITGGRKPRTFAAYAFRQGVARNWTETGRSTEFLPLPDACDFTAETAASAIHHMPTYVEKINLLEQVSLMGGFSPGRFCNFGDECEASQCLASFVCACNSCQQKNEAMMKSGRDKARRAKNKKPSNHCYKEESEVQPRFMH